MGYAYTDYTRGLKEFFNEYEKLKELEDAAADYTRSQEEIKTFQKQYLFKKSVFDENCNGKYIQFPIINKDGTRELKQKKVEDGKYEYLKPYNDTTKYPTYERAVIALRKDLNIIDYDPDLCITNQQYEDLKQDKAWLESKIKEYEKALSKVKSKISIYEWVNNIMR